MTRRWTVKVGIYPSRQAFLNDQPVRTVDVPVESNYRHSAMAEAEMEVRETLEGVEKENLEIWAIDAQTAD